MKWFLCVMFIYQLLSHTQGFLLQAEKTDQSTSKEITPLFLTPYIESGKIEEARELARVKFTESKKLGFKSYSGFFTVNKKYNSNQFFWYFPALENATDAPVLIWLSGGPGDTFMTGLFLENGPLTESYPGFRRKEHDLAMKHHVIYIDNPVGTGYSFTEDPKGYCTNQTQVGEHLYSIMVQFFQMFPELKQNKFFAFGESYGAKFATALAYTIHKKNPTAQVKINLQGIGIGNGLCDPVNQLQYSKYLYQIGLLGWNEANKLEKVENKIVDLIRKEDWINAAKIFDTLFRYDIQTLVKNMTGFLQYYNYLGRHAELNYDHKEHMFESTCDRKKIHIGNLEFNYKNPIVYNKLQPDFMKSVAPWIEELLEHYYVLAYSGQLDFFVPYPSTVNYLRKLKFSGSEQYEKAKRNIWMVDGYVAGYTRQGGKLIDALIRNAGQRVSLDQPEWSLALITQFTHHESNENFEIFVN